MKKELKKVCRLENWYMNMERRTLRGVVYDHPRFEDGSCIHTSSIMHLSSTECETVNTVYKLSNKMEYDDAS